MVTTHRQLRAALYCALSRHTILFFLCATSSVPYCSVLYCKLLHSNVLNFVLHCGCSTSQEYLDKYDEIPFKVLRFLFTEINYGGRVTDDKDRRLINNLVHTFCGPEVLDTDYK